MRPLLGTALAATLLLTPLTPPAAASHHPADHHPAPQHRVDRYTVPGDRAYPEGIARDPGTPHFYVSGTTDGTIWRGHVGRPTLEPFLPAGQHGRTTAVGMKITGGRLVVAGGATGKVFVHSTRTGALLHVFDSGARDGLVNDVAIAPNGDAYVTDSFRPVLYRITAAQLASPQVHQPLRTFVDLTDSPVRYEEGINGNGLVVTPDGRHVIMADTNSQAFYRVSTRTGAVTPVDLGGVTDIGSDGLLLRDGDLYSVTSLFHPEGEISVLRLSEDDSRATVLRRINGRGMDVPSTAAFDGDDLLVVNFQYQIAEPNLPFTVVRVRP
ncbi:MULTISPECIES: SMP-30/gluconolactonase/LRE family protein [Actinosynnema]|uniref:SMP-30/gluconolactonase/LRE family protein n=1 Tax=Actinosynnema TaxID=40566 RepID=UPI0020A3ECE4|nr:superoxide dismutase [Actinosynnema pretiosum]MCP2097653.1 Sugar lactone lactonase YvrE [Actinosynnema pretiosum]